MSNNSKKAVVFGAGGFIGGHLVERLKDEGYWVRGVDQKEHEYTDLPADDFMKADLRDIEVVREAIDDDVDELYQLAADMGGAGFVFTGENDAEVMRNSAQINLNAAEVAANKDVGKLFYSSSACVYPEGNQLDPDNPVCKEDTAYPANPDSEYGWEKLFSERMYFSYARNKGLDVNVARFHNIFGPKGAWNNGREKAPAALIRKVIKADDGGTITVWGDGKQTRTFLYIDECLEGVRRLMESDFEGPVNIGSEEMVSINEYVDMVADIANKDIEKDHDLSKPTGVRGRSSDNELIKEKLDWEPDSPLRNGVEKTYEWIKKQIQKNKS